MKELLHFLFPPLCLSCSERCDTGLFCPTCWLECAPLDPVGRCSHCFEEIEEEGLCAECIRRPHFFFVRASVFGQYSAPRKLFQRESIWIDGLAAYAMYQWIQLDWPRPDFILSIPSPFSSTLAKKFSEWLEVPYAHPFKRWSRHLIDELLPEKASFLILDLHTPFVQLKQIEKELVATSPKSCFLLSLRAHDSHHSESDFRPRP